MNSSKSIFAALFFAVFAFTSCQKESISEMSSVAETTTEQRNIPAEGIHTFNEAAKTEATSRTVSEFATSRGNTAQFIRDIFQPVYGTTAGQGNFFTSDNAPCLAGHYETFDGQDALYIFEVKPMPEAIVTHDITLTDLTGDVDLFVYTINPNGSFSECKATSITGGLVDEKVSMRDLNPGLYLIVIDGWNHSVTSSFTIQFAMSAVSANPPSINATDNVKSITTHTGTYHDFSGNDWALIIEDMAFPYQETARDANTITIQKVDQVADGVTTITVKFNLDTKEVEIIQAKQFNNGSAISNIGMDTILNVEYK